MTRSAIAKVDPLASAGAGRSAFAILRPELTTHVTIDARMVNHGGIGTHIRNVVPELMALRPDWTFSLLGNARELGAAIPRRSARIIECDARIYTVREQIEVARRVPRSTTVLWVPHYNIPFLRRVPMIVTVHDVAHLRLPEYGSVLRRTYARTLLQGARRRAAAVVFDSEFSRREFFELVGVPRGEYATVPVGLAKDWLRSTETFEPPIEGPYFLYVGNTKPHKNLSVLLDAFVALRDESNARLIIIGQTSGLRTGDAETVARLRATPGVSVVGEVQERVLRAYLSHARALVLPSLYEGFGLPPLEAMALGCPAIVARAASLPEVCGDGALFFTPSDSRELTGIMRRLTGDDTLRSTQIERGRAWVRQFEASRTAAHMASLMERAGSR